MTKQWPAIYRDGAVHVEHWNVSLRQIFGCAVEHHDMARGREVKVKLRGVTIGRIRLKDKLTHEPPPKVREDHRGQ